MNITVHQGGESLYIHPVAYYAYPRGNKVLFYEPHEYPLYAGEFVIQSSRTSDPNNRFYWNKGTFKLNWKLSVGRFCNALRRAIQFCWAHKSLDLWLFRYLFVNGTPFFGVDLFDGYISVKGQLVVQDPDHWSENYYLTPGQTYLKLRFDEWIAEAETGLEYLNQPEPEDTDNDWWNTKGHLKYQAEILVEYRAWASRWVEKGCKIGFVCALDT